MKFAMLACLFFFILTPAKAQRYQFAVEHLHTLRNCRGTLIITTEQIEYWTDHKPDARVWQYAEIRQITIVSPVELELATYEDQKRMMGRDRIFKLRWLEGKITSEVSALLMEKATRPIATSILPTSEGGSTFEVPVKHLHTFGGCSGKLEIYPDRIVFLSQTDTRFWRYSDIQNFSHSERYRFEIVGYEERFGGLKAYHFQLKADLPAQAYDYVWARVYPTKFRARERLWDNTSSKSARRN